MRMAAPHMLRRTNHASDARSFAVLQRVAEVSDEYGDAKIVELIDIPDPQRPGEFIPATAVRTRLRLLVELGVLVANQHRGWYPAYAPRVRDTSWGRVEREIQAIREVHRILQQMAADPPYHQDPEEIGRIIARRLREVRSR
jgi:hypothetical protein